MPFQLLITAGPDEGRAFALADGAAFVIGRGQESDTKLKDPRVSRQHVRIEVDGGTARLIDCGSSGGTLVNNTPATESVLAPGDVIRVGDTLLRFQLEGASEQETLVTAKPKSSPITVPGQLDLSSLVGQTIHHYRIDNVIAKGATGVVFKATHTKSDRPLAVKVLFPEISQNDEQTQRFIRAMKTMLPIKHPNIIEIYNAGKQAGYCWVAMEYVDGESLTKVIERIGTAGMLDWKDAFRVAVHIARALEAAFEHKFIHRNITPQNILLRKKDKRAKLGDLMLAKALESTNAAQITRPGQIIGDLTYMSPERTRGTEGVDCRSDIYSLGATVYALLTGRPPFEGDSVPDLINKVRNDELVKPKQFQLSIADMFEGAVIRMLAKRPEDRYDNPTTLLNDLERIGKFQGIEI